MDPVFLTVVYCFFQANFCQAVTLPRRYDSVRDCNEHHEEAVAEWTAGEKRDFQLLSKTCRPASPMMNPDARPAPEHLRDVVLTPSKNTI